MGKSCLDELLGCQPLKYSTRVMFVCSWYATGKVLQTRAIMMVGSCSMSLAGVNLAVFPYQNISNPFCYPNHIFNCNSEYVLIVNFTNLIWFGCIICLGDVPGHSAYCLCKHKAICHGQLSHIHQWISRVSFEMMIIIITIIIIIIIRLLLCLPI